MPTRRFATWTLDQVPERNLLCAACNWLLLSIALPQSSTRCVSLLQLALLFKPRLLRLVGSTVSVLLTDDSIYALPTTSGAPNPSCQLAHLSFLHWLCLSRLRSMSC